MHFPWPLAMAYKHIKSIKEMQNKKNLPCNLGPQQQSIYTFYSNTVASSILQLTFKINTKNYLVPSFTEVITILISVDYVRVI